MAESAAQRVARALDLVPYVSEHPGIEIAELAKRFNISEKQIIEDLELIFLCGLPGYTPYELIDLTYEDGVVTIIEPQLLDKPRKFSETEGVVITLGLNLIRDSTADLSAIEAIERLLDKLSRIFKAPVQATIADHVKPFLYDEIVRAIKSGVFIQFNYQSLSDDSLSYRKVKPVQISVKKGFYYLLAIEGNSQEERTFRIDQMVNLKITNDDKAEDQKVLKNKESFVFSLRTSDRFITEKYREIFSEVSSVGDTFTIRGEVSNLQWLQRWLLSNSPAVEISSPDSVRKAIRNRAQATLNLYQN
ncbi:MAG: WYL domain-containing protein [Actinomycetes bacterium]